jgi:IS30 family transposase
MIALLMDDLTSASVIGKFASLLELLGNDLYSKLFFVLLGDNGPEFSNPTAIEMDRHGNALCRVFYCDPMQSQQKGALEKNHTMIRRVIPKGTSLNRFTQDDISLMMNHVNSYGRRALNDLTPHHMFEFMYGQGPLKKLGADLVPADLITLRPSLLNRG